MKPRSASLLGVTGSKKAEHRIRWANGSKNEDKLRRSFSVITAWAGVSFPTRESYTTPRLARQTRINLSCFSAAASNKAAPGASDLVLDWGQLAYATAQEWECCEPQLACEQPCGTKACRLGSSIKSQCRQPERLSTPSTDPVLISGAISRHYGLEIGRWQSSPHRNARARQPLTLLCAMLLITGQGSKARLTT